MKRSSRKPTPAVSEPAATYGGTAVPATEFKATCLAWLDRVREGEQVVITKRGVPVARLVPVAPPAAALFGAMKGTVVGWKDLVSPVDRAWDADG
jgi:prevent-host-death family protein